MPAPVPVLGYRSKRAAAEALASEGKKPREIAPLLGLTQQQVYSLLPARLAQQGKKKPRGEPAHWSDQAHDPRGPFTYAEPKPSSLLDEIRLKAAAREARAAGQRYCLLVRADGKFLAEDGLTFTAARARAGRWTQSEIARMRAQNPAKRALQMELM